MGIREKHQALCGYPAVRIAIYVAVGVHDQLAP